MEEYNEKLIEQFKDARGIKKINSSSKMLQEDFSCWLKEQEKSKREYLDLLKQLKVEYDSKNAIEVGKNPVDSLFLYNNTTIVSPYFEGIENRTGLTLVGKPVIENDKMKYMDNESIKEININGGRIYLNHNIYNFAELNNWQVLARKDKVAVGVFGRTYDSNMLKKVREVKEFAKKLDDYVYDYGDIEDTYCYLIVSKQKKKIERR